MQTAGIDRRATVLDAAIGVFSRYGYRRTTMADLAAAGGVSRPALYLLFPNKEAIFRELAERLSVAALADVRKALDQPGGAADVIRRAILARDLAMFRLLASSPHCAEVLADSSTLTADIHAAAERRFAEILAAWLRARGDTEARTTAAMIAAAATGFKHSSGDEASYVANVTCFAALVGAMLD